GLDRVGLQFLAHPPEDLLREPKLLDFLAKLREEPNTSADLNTKISAVLAVSGYLDRPELDPAVMAAVANGLVAQPTVVPASAKGEVLAAVSQTIGKRAGESGLQANIEAALHHFGRVLANSPAELYECLVRDLRQRPDFNKNANLITAVLAIALGAVQSPELTGHLEGLEGTALAVAGEAAKKGGSRLLEEINRRAESWPKTARVQWGFLSAAIRPQRGKGLFRDALIFAAGAAAMGIVYWYSHFAGR
ncbi:MAG: hypothetical protein ACRD36_13220, partial [Candidatus Acidiferrum sp.]